MKQNEYKGPIAVVGGGIAGMYCAYVLRRNHYRVLLFEATERLGGRIRTIRLDSQGSALDSDLSAMEFHAEFGPMRYDADSHKLLSALIKHLEKENSDELKTKDFPPFSAPRADLSSKYTLLPSEAGKTTLQLLQLAIRRIMIHVEIDSDVAPDPAKENFDKWKKLLEKNIRLAEEVERDPAPFFLEAIKSLEEMPEVIWAIQTRGTVEYFNDGFVGGAEAKEDCSKLPLFTLGFWNLLSGYLSHGALLAVQSTGTFYHLMGENPNAAEWLAWWLASFSISSNLKWLTRGTESLVEVLRKKLDEETSSADGPKVIIRCNTRVTGLEPDRLTSGIKLRLSAGKEGVPGDTIFQNIVLALPKKPLRRILLGDAPVLDKSLEELDELTDSVFSFPMLKLLFIVKKRWWERDGEANESAGQVQARELHYFNSINDRHGMVMIYTDRPAQVYWANFVRSGPHTDVWSTKSKAPGNEDPLHQMARLKKKIVKLFRPLAGDDFSERDILWVGIRDWGRDPYGGNHAWRPKRRYWHVMKELAGLERWTRPCVHICGEAYSDYHGFMEGSLRSATYALAKIVSPECFSRLTGPTRPEVRVEDIKEALAFLEVADLVLEVSDLNSLAAWIRNIESDQGYLYHKCKETDELLRSPREASLPPGQTLTQKFPVVGEQAPSPEALDTSSAWHLIVDGLVEQPLRLSYSEILALPQRELVADIHCVTSWSQLGMRLEGVPLALLLERARPLPEARFVRFEAYSNRQHDTSLPLSLALEDTWLIHSRDGEPLSIEHGFPLRTVTPSRYFYKSLKWVHRIELLAEDRLGYWERESSYHNAADPWPGDQRFVSGSLSPEKLAAICEAESFASYRGPRKVILSADLRNWTPKTRKLGNLHLKNCDLRGAQLDGVDLERANLSLSDLRGASLAGAKLRGADLEGANFVGADLKGADLRDTSLSATKFFERQADGSLDGATIEGLRWEGGRELLEEQEDFLLGKIVILRNRGAGK